MGMRSTFNDETLTVTTSLKTFKELCNKHLNDEEESWSEFAKQNKDITNENEVTFKCFDDWKIQGYWYEGWCKFLIEVAEFIEGDVNFTYEEGQPYYLHFSKGLVECHYVPLNWEVMEFEWLAGQAKYTPEEARDIKVTRTTLGQL